MEQFPNPVLTEAIIVIVMIVNIIQFRYIYIMYYKVCNVFIVGSPHLLYMMNKCHILLYFLNNILAITLLIGIAITASEYALSIIAYILVAGFIPQVIISMIFTWWNDQSSLMSAFDIRRQRKENEHHSKIEAIHDYLHDLTKKQKVLPAPQTPADEKIERMQQKYLRIELKRRERDEKRGEELFRKKNKKSPKSIPTGAQSGAQPETV